MSGGAGVLLDRWELLDFAPGQGKADGGEGWMPVPAPGTPIWP